MGRYLQVDVMRQVAKPVWVVPAAWSHPSPFRGMTRAHECVCGEGMGGGGRGASRFQGA